VAYSAYHKQVLLLGLFWETACLSCPLNHGTIHGIRKQVFLTLLWSSLPMFLWICRRLVVHIINTIAYSNTKAEKWLVIAHYRVGVNTQSVLKGTKHFNSVQL